jgi:hypothetical protein
VALSIGQDLEFFLKDRKGRIVPAHKYLPPKEEAIEVPLGDGEGTGGGSAKIYRDGLAAEINTPGGHCRAYLWNDVMYTVKSGLSIAGATKNKVKASLTPVADIDLHALREEYPDDVKQFGCVPTFNAYTKGRDAPNADPMSLPFRSAGGHMHLTQLQQKEVDDIDYVCTLTKVCDLLIGLPITVATADDLDFKRRELYGKAGEFRIKDHSTAADKRPYWGHEYRVLSPRLFRHPALTSLAFGIYRDVIGLNHPALVEAWNTILDEPLQKAINTGEGALELLEEWEKVIREFDDIWRQEQRAQSEELYKKYSSYYSLRKLTVKTLLDAKNAAKKVGDDFPTWRMWGDGHKHGWGDYCPKWGGKDPKPVKFKWKPLKAPIIAPPLEYYTGGDNF